ncbi:MAG: radical SAM protein [Desulfobacteraceae bacterium]|nr:radical SAM protein [Desulfobacteraceae bacterium]
MNNNKVLLIHPPVSKPCEPPPGIAKLAGALKKYHIEVNIIDSNLEGMMYLNQLPLQADDTWTHRAFSRRKQNLEIIKRTKTYQNPDRYRQAVFELNRILQIHGRNAGVNISLTNYQQPDLSPVISSDLITAYKSHEKNLFFPYFEKRLREVITNDNPGIIGFSVNFLNQALCAFAMAGYLRKVTRNIQIIMGGGLITSWKRQPAWINPFEEIIDHLIAGPGEDAILALVGKKNYGKEGNGEGYHGEDYHKDHILPDFDKLISNQYLSPGLIIPFSASSGCYWGKCSFCPETAEKNLYEQTPKKIVISQLKQLTNRYSPALIHLTDNTLSPSLLKEMAIDPPGAPWYGFARITNHLTDIGFCMALKKSGCVMLQIGLESGSQNVIDAFKKGIDLKIAEKALACLKQAGIATYVYLLFGTPSETETDALKTLDFTAQHSDNISFLNLSIFNLPIYSEETNSLNTSHFYAGDLSFYKNFNPPSGWNRNKVREFLDKRFKRHPAIAPILRNDPPVFTSNHAALFCIH